jgi:uncharacterized repeat protein (TIGR03803 family)
VPFFGNADGAHAQAGVIVGSDGNLAASHAGRRRQLGAVLRWRGGAVTVLHSFRNQGDGAQPISALVRPDGSFYGSSNVEVFKIAADGTFSVVQDLLSSAGAQLPSALIQASDGNFYFTTQAGGTALAGAVLKMTPGGTVTVLHNFSGGTNDGAFPAAALVQATDGNFYGTTTSGGAFGSGTIFRITPGGVLTLLHSFNPNVDGAIRVRSSGGRWRSAVTYRNGPGTSAGTCSRPAGPRSPCCTCSTTRRDGFAVGGLIQATPGGTFFGTTAFGSDFGWALCSERRRPASSRFLRKFNLTDGGTLAAGSSTQAGSFYGGHSRWANGCGVVYTSS